MPALCSVPMRAMWALLLVGLLACGRITHPAGELAEVTVDAGEGLGDAGTEQGLADGGSVSPGLPNGTFCFEDSACASGYCTPGRTGFCETSTHCEDRHCEPSGVQCRNCCSGSCHQTTVLCNVSKTVSVCD